MGPLSWAYPGLVSTSRRTSLLFLLSACLILTPGCSGADDPSPDASSSGPVVGTPDPTTAPTAVSTPPSADAQAEAQVEEGDLSADLLGAVALGEAVALDDGLVVSAGGLSATDVAAGPGEIGGPGIVVPVTVSNATQADMPLEGLVVSLEYGPESTPAPQALSASDMVPEVLSPGQAVVIEMVFAVPFEGRDQVRVVVDSGAESRAAVFEGQAPSS